jgi:hypothetical protein
MEQQDTKSELPLPVTTQKEVKKSKSEPKSEPKLQQIDSPKEATAPVVQESARQAVDVPSEVKPTSTGLNTWVLLCETKWDDSNYIATYAMPMTGRGVIIEVISVYNNIKTVTVTTAAGVKILNTNTGAELVVDA